MLNPEEIANWKFGDLKEFVQATKHIEDKSFEFKESLNFREPPKIRKDFSAFANTSGGIIFVGIKNDKKIIGIDEDIELNTKINRCLSNSALQPGEISWNLINVLSVPPKKSRKFVYIYYIQPSLSYQKPHVSDYKIHIREQGESKAISSGYQLRQLFFLSRFDPSHIDQLEYELQKIRQYEYQRIEIDIFYFRYLRQFLEESIQEKKDKGYNTAEIDELLPQFYRIQKLMEEIESLRAKVRSSTRAPVPSVSGNIKTKYSELARIVHDFIINFKKVYKQ